MRWCKVFGWSEDEESESRRSDIFGTGVVWKKQWIF